MHGHALRVAAVLAQVALCVCRPTHFASAGWRLALQDLEGQAAAEAAGLGRTYCFGQGRPYPNQHEDPQPDAYGSVVAGLDTAVGPVNGPQRRQAGFFNVPVFAPVPSVVPAPQTASIWNVVSFPKKGRPVTTTTKGTAAPSAVKPTVKAKTTTTIPPAAATIAPFTPIAPLPPLPERAGDRARDPYLWPDRTVTYALDSSLQEYPVVVQQISMALAAIEAASCVRFQKRTSADQYHVRFGIWDWATCFSSTVGSGQHLGVQHHRVNLGSSTGRIDGHWCGYMGAVHEILHVLGVHHQVMRSDRDNHVRINYDDIQPFALPNFNTQDFSLLDTAFNPASVMMYDSWAAAIDPTRPTIVDRVTGQPLPSKGILQEKLSPGDILFINRLYRCNA